MRDPTRFLQILDELTVEFINSGNDAKKPDKEIATVDQNTANDVRTSERMPKM